MAGRNWEDHSHEIKELIGSMKPVHLAELSGNLQDRYDEKYHVPAGIFQALLEGVAGDYRVLDVEGVRDYAYVSTYLDLPGFPMFLAHHNGKKERYKVRFRRYVHSGKVYLEVKHKINKGKTIKKRIVRPAEEEHLSGISVGFLRTWTPFDPLQMRAVLRVSFSRITLAAPGGKERITWDHGLRFSYGGKEVGLPGFGVMEIKHEGRKHNSPMTRLLSRYRIFPAGFSKYCTGILLLYPEVKYNRFKPLLRKLKTERYDVTATAHGGRG